MPRKVSQDDPTRMYKSDLVERLTRAHPAEPFFIFIPAVLTLLFFAFSSSRWSWYTDIAVFVGGVFWWTFTEYVLHRWLFHYEAKTEFGKKNMKLIHGIHHQFPNDTDRLVIPPAAGVLVAIGGFFVYALLIGFWAAIPFVGGWVTGYMAYDFTHYSTHHRKPRTKWARVARRRHLVHHYKLPEACFGVSTGLWDWVFQTSELQAKKKGMVGHNPPEGVWEVIDNEIV